MEKTIGIVEVAALAAKAGRIAAYGRDDAHRLADQIRGESRQSPVIAPRPTVLDRQILSLDVAHFGKTLPKASHLGRKSLRVSGN
jgi:hypothetical protein